MSCPEGKEMFADLFDRYCKTMDWANGDGLGEGSKELVMAMIKDTPIRGLLCYDDRPEINRVWLGEMLERLNSMLEG